MARELLLVGVPAQQRSPVVRCRAVPDVRLMRRGGRASFVTDHDGMPAALRAADAVGLVLLAPLLEELIFRGYGHAVLIELGVVPAALITSAAFALWHANPVMIPTAFVVGLILFVSYAWSGTLIVPVLGHAIGNLAFLVVARTGSCSRPDAAPIATPGGTRRR